MQAASSIPQHSSVYQIVTEQIIKQSESGVAPWHRPWATQMPKNLISKREYRGINVFLLASRGYGSPYWLTYKQATEQSGNVRRGEHGSKVVFWKIDKYDSEDADGHTVAKTSASVCEYRIGKDAMAKTYYSTEVAAKRIGVSFRTLNRWLNLGKIKPSMGIPFSDGRMLWRWTDADVAKGRKVKAAQKPGPKPTN